MGENEKMNKGGRGEDKNTYKGKIFAKDFETFFVKIICFNFTILDFRFVVLLSVNLLLRSVKSAVLHRIFMQICTLQLCYSLCNFSKGESNSFSL